MNTAELLERYLQAVRFWLPSAQQNDLIAELSEDIRSQIEDKESEIGRPLNEGELAALLKGCGTPFVVAHNYVPRRCLIGPVLYPIYLLLLKGFMLLWVAPWLLVWLGFLSFSPAYRAHHPFRELSGLWLVVLYIVFNTTLAFAIVERLVNPAVMQAKEWDPRRLPPVGMTDQISRANALFALGANMAVLAWWLCLIPRSTVAVISGLQLTLAPIWPLMFWFIFALAAAKIALWSLNLVRPFWTKQRLMARLVMDAVATVAVCTLFTAHLVTGISGPDVSVARSAQDLDALNAARSAAFWAVLACGLMAVLLDMRRFLGLKARRF